jgi:soluble lytic murein transglycosylase-like protein
MPDPFLDNLSAVGVADTPAPAFDLDATVAEASQKYGVDQKLLRAVIGQESSGKQSAVSPKGATGLMQLMPGTAKALGVDPSDPYQNIMGGTRYLKEQIDSFGGDVPLALAAYNAGPNAVKKHGGIPPYKETKNYLRKIGEAMGWPAEAEAAE